MSAIEFDSPYEQGTRVRVEWNGKALVVSFDDGGTQTAIIDPVQLCVDVSNQVPITTLESQQRAPRKLTITMESHGDWDRPGSGLVLWVGRSVEVLLDRWLPGVVIETSNDCEAGRTPELRDLPGVATARLADGREVTASHDCFRVPAAS